MNIVENHNLQLGLKHWFGQGSARLSISSGAPTCVPSAAALSLPCPPCLSGNCLVASNRTQWWEGPAQTITEKLELFVVYQVSAWVRVGNYHGKTGQKVNVALSLDGKWMTGGEVEVDQSSWKEIVGSFRLEKKPNYAMVYVQGPEPGVDLMLAGKYLLKRFFHHAVCSFLLNCLSIVRIVLRMCGLTSEFGDRIANICC